MHGLLARFWEYCQQSALFTPGKVIVAVSGGADSLTLLHMLHSLQHKLNITPQVAHFDHKIRVDSRDDARFVEQFASSLGLLCTTMVEDIPALAAREGIGIEAAARTARYAFLTTLAQSEEAQIVTAHHRDDQAETVLMHLLRGTGLAGLRGMLPRTELKPGIFLIRPLLPFSRAQIDAYVQENGLTPRMDSTNADTAYLRNRLRLEIIPLLKTINPALDEALSQLATVVQDDFAALTALIPPYPYHRATFAGLPLSIQRLAIQQNPVRRDDLTFHDVENALTFIWQGKPGDSFTLSNDLRVALDFEYIRFDENMELHAPGIAPGSQLELLPDAVVRLENGWQLRVSTQPTNDPDEIAIAIPADHQLILRTRRTGEIFFPEGMEGHSQKLSDTFVNMKVPAIWRDHVPLLTAVNMKVLPASHKRVGLLPTQDRILMFIAPTPQGLKVRKAQPVSNAAATLFFQIKFTL